MILGNLIEKSDPRTLNLSRFLGSYFSSPPPKCEWGKAVNFKVWSNDVCNCCVFSAQAALLANWTTAAQAPIILSEHQVLLNYIQVCGYDAAKNYDPGASFLEVLNYWRKLGLYRPGPILDYLTLYGSIDHKDHEHVKSAVYFLGGMLAGIYIPINAIDLLEWDIQALEAKEPRILHAIAVVGYNQSGLDIVAWGKKRRMPWASWDACVRESYGLLSRQNWIRIEGISPAQETFNTLISRCSQELKI